MVLAALAALPPRALSQDHDPAPAIASELAKQKETADKRRKAMEQLSAEERRLGAGLTGLEAKVGVLSGQLAEKERLVHEVMAEEARLSAEHAALSRQLDAARSHMSGLLTALWPVHLNNLEAKAAGLASWEEADRRFMWLSELYAAAGQSYAAYREQSARLAANMAAQETARTKLAKARAEAEKSKDALLAEQLEFSKQLRNVRRRIVSEEEQLKDILHTIGELDARMAAAKAAPAPVVKGSMAWPVPGAPIFGFDPAATPPRRGMGFSCAENAPVKAVSPGKVVFSDLLRGMGKVVIVSHGDGHFTVYAYLADIAVSMGQEVAGDDALGRAGYYPPAGGPGLYFELRFHEKAINPVDWLAARD
jgi:septal ring factor EnvC (AmiA/AmiB activator)